MQDKLGYDVTSQANLLWYLEYVSAFGVVEASAEVVYNSI